MPSNSLQRLLTAIFPRRWAEDMEAESRTWMMRCPCGAERSIWDAGGIRWKAAGTKRTLMRCPQCGQITWQTISRTSGEKKSNVALDELG